jgi:hypothetical protein
MPRVQIAENTIGLAQPSQARLVPADNNGGVAGGMAAGLVELGGQLANTAQVRRDLQAQEQAADFAKRFADARIVYDRQRADARAQAGPGAAGYTDTMGKAFDDTFNPLLSGISDKRVLRQAQSQLQQYRAENATSDYDFELTARSAKMVGDASDTIDTASARVRASGDPQAYSQERLNVYTMVQGLPISDAKKQALWRKGQADLAGADIGRKIDANPQQVRTDIERGMYADAGLDGKQIDAFLAQADVGVRRIQSEQQHQIALAKSALSEQIATVKAQLGAGVNVPDAQLAQLAQQAQAVGDTSNAFDLSEARVRNNFNQLSKGWTPQQLESQRNALLAKGTKRTPQEDILLDQIEKRMPSMVEDFNRDPGKWAASNGVPPPQINWQDQSTIDARRRWVATVSGATGRPTPFFSANEVADLKAKAEASPAGEVAVLNNVAMIGGRQAVTEMQRILPDDPKAARLVLLNPSARGQALAGMEVLKDRPDTLPDKLTRQPFEDRLGAAGRLMDGSQIEGVYGVAKGLYVDMARKSGIALGKDTDFNDNLWNAAIHRALGGRYDGQSNKWFGGVWTWGKNPVLIPNTVTGKQFEGAMAKLGGAGEWGTKTYPVYSNGTAIPPSVLVRSFIPVLRPDGWYEFVGPDGNPVPGKSGQTFRIDLEATARKYPQ